MFPSPSLPPLLALLALLRLSYSTTIPHTLHALSKRAPVKCFTRLHVRPFLYHDCLNAINSMNGNDPAGIHDIKTFGRPGTGAQNEFTDKTWTAGTCVVQLVPEQNTPQAVTYSQLQSVAIRIATNCVFVQGKVGSSYVDRRSSDPEFLRPDSLLIWVYPVGGRKNEFLGWEIVTELGLKLNAACVAAERNRDGGEGNEDSCVVGGGEGSGSESGSGVMDGYSVSGSSVGVAVAGVSP